MRSLFLRVFLWFWLAMASVVVVLVVTSPYFTRSRPGLEDWHRNAEDWTRGMVDRVAMRVEKTGIGGLPPGGGSGRGHPEGGRPPVPAKIFVIDREGNELRGDGAPREVFEIARRALESGGELSERTGVLHLIARPVDAAGGRRVAVVAAHHRPPRMVHLIEPEALAWRLGVLVLVVGGLSFWLARYLSSPMASLRRATRRLSGGDLTARVGERAVRRRDEIGELARDFNAMAGRVEVLVGSQRRLLRDVSHELRSPLARITVALELARSRAGDEASNPHDRIEREAARLDELIGRLLLLERLEVGGTGDDPVELDLSELLGEVVADAGFEAAAEGRRIELDRGGPFVLSGRPQLLHSAFDNLLRNALQHTPEGTAVEVGARWAGDELEISVRDHGPGVGADDLERIFHPFYRVDEARDRDSGGAGLGLAIARRAIELHGGSVQARNHEEGGLVIVVKLPRLCPKVAVRGQA
jgi:two-component system sensor histidine kinase CpxA